MRNYISEILFGRRTLHSAAAALNKRRRAGSIENHSIISKKMCVISILACFDLPQHQPTTLR